MTIAKSNNISECPSTLLGYASDSLAAMWDAKTGGFDDISGNGQHMQPHDVSLKNGAFVADNVAGFMRANVNERLAAFDYTSQDLTFDFSVGTARWDFINQCMFTTNPDNIGYAALFGLRFDALGKNTNAYASIGSDQESLHYAFPTHQHMFSACIIRRKTVSNETSVDLYVDGVFVKSIVATTHPPFSCSSITGIQLFGYFNSLDFVAFSGPLYSMRVYDRGLTPKEIAANHAIDKRRNFA